MEEQAPRPRISPAPNWTSIFTLRDDLTPPGYAETVLHILDNPRVKPKDLKKEEAAKKKKKSKLGRNQKA
jgi:hypothetical protein